MPGFWPSKPTVWLKFDPKLGPNMNCNYSRESLKGAKHTFWGYYTFSTPCSNKVLRVQCGMPFHQIVPSPSTALVQKSNQLHEIFDLIVHLQPYLGISKIQAVMLPWHFLLFLLSYYFFLFALWDAWSWSMQMWFCTMARYTTYLLGLL